MFWLGLITGFLVSAIGLLMFSKEIKLWMLKVETELQSLSNLVHNNFEKDIKGAETNVSNVKNEINHQIDVAKENVTKAVKDLEGKNNAS